MNEMTTDIAVIGGGAAGLTAADTAASTGARVLVLERLARVGKKLLVTGNGRCNLGNRSTTPDHWHGNAPQRTEILARFGDCEDFFAARGLYCQSDEAGRLYPMSNMAASVLDALRFSVAQHGVTLRCDSRVTALSRERGGFLLQTEDGAVIHAARVIFAAGGSAAPSCGTDGSAFALLQRLGHTVTPLVPSLAPVRTDTKAVAPLKGIRVQAAATALLRGKPLKTEVGEVQFTDGALSGICLFHLSRFAAQKGDLRISLRLLPSWNDETIRKRLTAIAKQRSMLPAEELLTGLLPKRVGTVLLKGCGIALGAPTGQIARGQLEQLAHLLSDWQFPVTGVSPFSAAQVTAGGVPGTELSPTLESRVAPGLFLAGECVDVDGDCGGFNLMWAWASGQCAGQAAAQSLATKRKGIIQS